MLLEVTEELRDAGVASIVLKGPAHAHLAYPDPALRAYGDIDLLVGSDDFGTAVEVLQGHGFTRPQAAPSERFDREFGKGATLKGPRGNELDLHRTFLFGAFGLTIDLAALFESVEHFEVGGTRIAGLGAEERLLHACYHTALGNVTPRVSSVRDVAQMMAPGACDQRRAVWLAGSWGGRAVVGRAVDLVEEQLGIRLEGPLVDWARAHTPSRAEHRAIDAHVGHNNSFAAKVTAALRVLPWRGKVALVRELLAPSEGFVSQRGPSKAAWFWRGIRSRLGR